MKNVAYRSVVLACFLSLVGAVVQAAPISITIGDNDGYGLGVPDNGTAVWPGPGFSGTPYDGRSLAEASAINGAQFTDVYAALYPGFGPNATAVGNFLFNFTGTLQSATLRVDMGDFQGTSRPLVYFNGVLQAGLFAFNDGFQATAVRDFVLNPAAIANANLAGQFVVTVDNTNGNDFVAFDFMQLNGVVSTAEVPEPASLALWGMGTLGFAWFARRKKTQVA